MKAFAAHLVSIALALSFDANGQKYTIEVAGNSPWTDTQIDVTAGQRLTITAKGSVRYGGLADKYTDANGIGPRNPGTVLGDTTIVFPKTVILSLVGKIGGTTALDSGTRLPAGVGSKGEGFVGTDYSQIVPSSGRLYLGYNDGRDEFGNNSGSFTAIVEVSGDVATTRPRKSGHAPPNSHSLRFEHNAYVSIPFTNLGTSPITIELWFKPATDLIPPVAPTVLFALVNGNRYSDGILANDHMGNLGGYTYADTFNELNCSQRVWSKDRWYHLAYVRDTNQTQRLYLNGGLDGKDSCFGRIDPNTDINIGGHGAYGNQGRWFFTGNIDEVRIWRRALTADEIQLEFAHRLRTVNLSDLLGYWNFDEGAGDVVQDTSGNGYHGSMRGAAWSKDVPAATGNTGPADKHVNE